MTDTFVSHAQNFEDVILWRALGHVADGTYVDVGAQDPAIDSVSLAFHERGWRGVHVEASPQYAAALRAARPDDLVIEAAVSDAGGSLEFFEFPDTGLGTGDAEMARRHERAGHELRRIEVPCVRLDDVLARVEARDVHWLKIDVEGMEGAVLSSWRSDVRPWIVVVEATAPLSSDESHAGWEPDLLARGYRFVYFDGLNRFYLSDDHAELERFFGPGPNVFDNFALDGRASAPFCARVNAERDAALAGQHRAEAERERTAAELASSRGRLAEAEAVTAAMQAELDRHVEAVAGLAALVEAHRTSASWRITAPLRVAGRAAEHGRVGLGAWLRMDPASRPRRVLARSATRAEVVVRSNPRLSSLVSRGLARSPALRALTARVRAAAVPPIAPYRAEGDFRVADHPLRAELLAMLETEIAARRSAG